MRALDGSRWWFRSVVCGRPVVAADISNQLSLQKQVSHSIILVKFLILVKFIIAVNCNADIFDINVSVCLPHAISISITHAILITHAIWITHELLITHAIRCPVYSSERFARVEIRLVAGSSDLTMVRLGLMNK